MSSRGAPRPRGAAGRRDRRSSLFLHSFLPSCPPTSEYQYANADLKCISWRCVVPVASAHTALDLQTVWINPNSMIVVRRRGGTLPVVLVR